MKRDNQSLLPPLWVFTLALIVLAVYVLLELRELVAFLVIGYSIAYVLDPVLDYLQTKKVSRQLGLVVLISALVGLGIILAVTVVPVLIEEAKHFLVFAGEYIGNAKSRLREITLFLQRYIPNLKMPVGADSKTTLPPIDGETIKGIFYGLFQVLFQGYSITLTIINVTLLPFVVYYLALDIDIFHRWVTSAVPRKYRREFRDLASEIHQHTSAFVIGQILVCCILFVLYTLGFFILGLKLWFLLGVIAGFGNIIPYLGFALGIVLASIMSLATYGDWSNLLLTWLVFAIVQCLEGFVITPKIVGNKVGLPPLLVILALVAGGKLFGLLGLFLAIPGAAALRVLLTRGHKRLLETIEDQ